MTVYSNIQQYIVHSRTFLSFGLFVFLNISLTLLIYVYLPQYVSILFSFSVSFTLLLCSVFSFFCFYLFFFSVLYYLLFHQSYISFFSVLSCFLFYVFSISLFLFYLLTSLKENMHIVSHISLSPSHSLFLSFCLSLSLLKRSKCI